LEEIQATKYFLKFNSFYDILDEIKDRIDNNKIILKEKDNNLILNIPLPENEEIIFELKPFIKNTNNRLNELTDLIIKLNTEMNNIKNEEISKLKKEIKDMKDKEEQLNNDNTQLKNDINLLKNEIELLNKDNTQFINDKSQLISENDQLKKEVAELKEKLNILWDENKMIFNLDSKIINENKEYNETLKYWINPLRKIKAELLYRLSDNGDKFSIFHKLCDNKGPTLTLFHINDGNIIGIYTPLSYDTTSGEKNDMDTFIFNLNKNQKYKKLKPECSILCDRPYGPDTYGLGCEKSMKSITHYAILNINEYYDKGSEILSSNNQAKDYDLIETELYNIIIEYYTLYLHEQHLDILDNDSHF